MKVVDSSTERSSSTYLGSDSAGDLDDTWGQKLDMNMLVDAHTACKFDGKVKSGSSTKVTFKLGLSIVLEEAGSPHLNDSRRLYLKRLVSQTI